MGDIFELKAWSPALPSQGTPLECNIEPEVPLDTPLKFYESGFP